MPTFLVSRITYLPVAEQDFEELAALRIAAMRESLERVGRYDPERARRRLRDNYAPAHSCVIALDGARIGFYTLRPDGGALRLDHLYILPSSQRLGVGAEVMRHIAAQADRQEMPVMLGALRDSASNRFYLRHGYVQTGEDEWDIYYTRPAIRSSAA